MNILGYEDSQDYENHMAIYEAEYDDLTAKLSVLYELLADGENVESEIEHLQEERGRLHNLMTEYE